MKETDTLLLKVAHQIYRNSFPGLGIGVTTESRADIDLICTEHRVYHLSGCHWDLNQDCMIPPLDALFTRSGYYGSLKASLSIKVNCLYL